MDVNRNTLCYEHTYPWDSNPVNIHKISVLWMLTDTLHMRGNLISVLWMLTGLL